jgi:putative aldouronate transport system substrate-binding protein
MKRMKILGLGIVLMLAIIPMLFAGGGGQSQSTSGGTSSANYVGPNKSYSGYPLPIVERPLELTAMVEYTSLRPNMDTTRVWDWFFDKTNIRIKPIAYNDREKASLVFASRDFPDFYMSGISSTSPLWLSAERDGDLVPLDDLLARYAPTWNKFINDNRIVKNGISMNGKVYFLPFINWAENDRDIRDLWVITQAWLDELGIKTPTTTGEFKNAMLAIKNNAGRGSIPRNVIPFYYLFDAYLGGQFDVYGAFGVNITDGDYVVVDNGRVVFQATNPDLRAPLKYLQELYLEGITPPECFTDDGNARTSKTTANPPIVASYASYGTGDVPGMQTVMAPPQSPNGKKPTMRRQAYVANSTQRLAIFENCKDSVALIKFAEFIAFDIEANMTSTRGMKDVFWRFRPDGKAEQIFWEESWDRMNANSSVMGLWNSFIGLWDKNFFANLYYDTQQDIKGSRMWAFENVYKNNLAPEGSTYVSAPLSADETSLMNTYNTDLTNERKQTFARWITTNANIDAEWDAYVARMNRLHIPEFVALKQKAYDLLAR